MKTFYSDSFNPPAPAVSVQVSSSEDIAHSPTLLALVDTGSDTTLIPETLADQLRLAPAGEVDVQAYEGTPKTVTFYDVILRVSNLRLVGLSVVTFSADYVLLGRDVLNHLCLLLDGPALALEILPPAES
jgi:predicted aspartyl protease